MSGFCDSSSRASVASTAGTIHGDPKIVQGLPAAPVMKTHENGRPEDTNSDWARGRGRVKGQSNTKNQRALNIDLSNLVKNKAPPR